MRSLAFLMREFLLSLSQNRFLHFTYATQVTISLLVLGLFFVLLIGAAVWWNHLGDYVRVHVFIASSLTVEDRERMGTEIQAIPHVKEVEYRSEDDALRVMQEKQPALRLSETLEDNPLPASFIISADHARHIDGIVAAAEHMPGVDSLRYPTELVGSYLKVLLILAVISLVTILLLLVFTASSISNIIGLSIYARRTEIRIMQLVGATWWFIRWPFLFEGLFFGLVGAVIALLIIWGLLVIMGEALKLSQLSMALPSVGLSTGGLFLALAVVMIGLGCAVGLLGSLRTVNAFLSREMDIQLDSLRVRRLMR